MLWSGFSVARLASFQISDILVHCNNKFSSNLLRSRRRYDDLVKENC